MSKNIAEIAVYYREIPAILKTFIDDDPNMQCVKDGVKKILGQSCPRLTIAIESAGYREDKKRIDALERLLSELEDNNQIVSFSTRLKRP